MTNRNSFVNMCRFCETTQALKKYVKSPYTRKLKAKRFFKNILPYVLVMIFIVLFHNIISAIIDLQFIEVTK